MKFKNTYLFVCITKIVHSQIVTVSAKCLCFTEASCFCAWLPRVWMSGIGLGTISMLHNTVQCTGQRVGPLDSQWLFGWISREHAFQEAEERKINGPEGQVLTCWLSSLALHTQQWPLHNFHLNSFLLIQNLKKRRSKMSNILAYICIIYNTFFFWNIPLGRISQVLRSRNHLSYLLSPFYPYPWLLTFIFSI